MTRSIQCVLLAITVLSIIFATGGRHVAYAVEPTTQPLLGLPDLIQEALARNPEIVVARKQWEASSHRIAQARALEDPTLSVQWWNFPESFNLGQSGNTIIGLSQKFPFPGKLALKEEVASRSAEMTEQALRARERDLIARVKRAYYDLFLVHKAIQIHHEQIALLRQFVDSAMAKFRTGHGSQVDVLKAQVNSPCCISNSRCWSSVTTRRRVPSIRC